jgi:protein CWC15
LAAEAEARNKKRKAEGKPPLEEDLRKAAAIEAPKEGTLATDDEANKRRKLLQETLEMDKDDEDDEEEEEEKNDDDGDRRYTPDVFRRPLGF